MFGEWGTCLTLVDKTSFFFLICDLKMGYIARPCWWKWFIFNLWFEGEAHASLLLKIYIFFQIRVFRWNACLTHVSKTKILWIMIFSVRHMPPLYWLNLIYLYLWFWRWGAYLTLVKNLYFFEIEFFGLGPCHALVHKTFFFTHGF